MYTCWLCNLRPPHPVHTTNSNANLNSASPHYEHHLHVATYAHIHPTHALPWTITCTHGTARAHHMCGACGACVGCGACAGHICTSNEVRRLACRNASHVDKQVLHNANETAQHASMPQTENISVTHNHSQKSILFWLFVHVHQ